MSPLKPDTSCPIQLTSTGRGCSHQPGYPSQELHILRPRASQTQALTTGSPALYQLSYRTCDYNQNSSLVVSVWAVRIPNQEVSQSYELCGQRYLTSNFKGCNFDLTQFMLPHLEVILSLTQYTCHLW